MANRRLGLALAATLILISPAGVPAQQPTPPAAPQKAKEQPKPKSKAKRVWGEEDVKELRKPWDQSEEEKKDETKAGAATDAKAAGPVLAPNKSADDKSGSSPEQTPEQVWRQRFAQAREDIARTEQEIARLQRAFDAAAAPAAIEKMGWSGPVSCPRKSNVFLPGYLPPGDLGAANLNSLCSQLNERKDHLDAAKARLVTLEDDLRRAGGYPGWARE